MTVTIALSTAALATLKVTTRPIATIAVPAFPSTLVEAGLMGIDGFLMGADGSILQGVQQ